MNFCIFATIRELSVTQTEMIHCHGGTQILSVIAMTK